MNDDANRLQKICRSLDGPASRWKQAERRANKYRLGSSAAADDLVGQTAEYLYLRRRGVSGATCASQKHPLVDAAVRLWANDAIREQLRLLVIADCPRKEIASRLELDEQVIVVAELLFFDVRASLRASGWITCHVIIPLIRAGALDLAARLKLAYFGGPVVARAILDARIRVPTEEADRLFDQEVLLHLKVQEALEAPLGEAERIEFLKLYLQYDINRQRLDLERKKFAHHCKRNEGRVDCGEPQGEASDGTSREESSSADSDWPCDADNEWGAATEALLSRLIA